MVTVRTLGWGLGVILAVIITLRICSDLGTEVLHSGDCPPCILPRCPTHHRRRGQGGDAPPPDHQQPAARDCPPIPSCPECDRCATCPPAPACPGAPAAIAAPGTAAAAPADGKMSCSVDPGSGAVTCAAPQLRIAVVVPFVGHQRNYVLSNLWSWGLPEFAPCTDATSSVSSRVDLVFYVSRDTDEWKRTRADIEEFLAESPARKCFGTIHYISADVPEAKDVYGAGTLAQFYGIFDREYLKLPAFDYILYQEPDTRPIRAEWVPALYTEIASRHPFWSIGSAPRYGSSEVLHINGNAVYRYAGDAAWLKYLCASRGAFTEYASFDQSLEVHRKKKRMYDVAHRFAYTDLIQNRADQRQRDFKKFLRDNPHTYLVHGKGIVASIKAAGFHNSKFTTDNKPPKHAVKDSLTDSGANACRK